MHTVLNKSLIWLPTLVLVGLGFFILSFFISQSASSQGFILLDSYYLKVIFFTLYQAFLGASLSLFIAFMLMGFLCKIHHTLVGQWLNRFIFIPFFLPSIVGCLALVIIFGQGGLFSMVCTSLGFSYTTFLYGLEGILLCHVFYYVPYTLRIMLNHLPQEYNHLIYFYHISYGTRLRKILYPVLKKELGFSFALVFMYCSRSFTPILIFGGLPCHTTLEVALYQALNFDFDWGIASQLALVSLGLHFLILSFFSFRKQELRTYPLLHKGQWPFSLKGGDCLSILFILIFFLLPLGAIFFNGYGRLMDILKESQVWYSLGITLSIGFLSAGLAFIFLASLIYLSYRYRHHKKRVLFFKEIPVNLMMICSPIAVISMLYILFINQLEHSFRVILIIAFIDGVCFLPTMYRFLYFKYHRCRQSYDQLCSALNLEGFKRFWKIDFPLLKPSFGHALSLCLIFSISDSRAILFFNHQHFQTLTSLIYEKMQMYHFHQAAAISVLSVLLIFFVSGFIEKIFGTSSS